MVLTRPSRTRRCRWRKTLSWDGRWITGTWRSLLQQKFTSPSPVFFYLERLKGLKVSSHKYGNLLWCDGGGCMSLRDRGSGLRVFTTRVRGWKVKFVPQWWSEGAETITVSICWEEEENSPQIADWIRARCVWWGEGGGATSAVSSSLLTDNQMTNPHPSHQWYCCTSLYSCMVGINTYQNKPTQLHFVLLFMYITPPSQQWIPLLILGSLSLILIGLKCCLNG